MSVAHGEVVQPSWGEAVRFWLKLGFISFGGPAGQIAVMHTELVERKKWVEESRFLQALNFCMLLPGPEATQLAIYCGWRLHGMRGGVIAGVLFVLPAALLLWGLSYVYVTLGHVAWVAAIFHGLKPAVTAIVAAAVIRIGAKSLQTPGRWAVAGTAFAAIFFGGVPFPAIVAGAAVLGWCGWRWRALNPPAGDVARAEPLAAAHALRPSWRRAGRVIGVSLTLWFAPIMLAGLLQGWDGVLVREGVFFSKAAMVTFGGAYAVLPYVGQQAVETHGWLTAPQMLDGLALAETTPGPLIMVVQFVGFLGGWNHAGGGNPLLVATLGAAMTTWTTFVPCFLWIFLGAPHLECWREHARVNAALGVVTAAVVGVVLNLAVWFALQTFRPAGGGVDLFAGAVAVAAFVAMQRFKAGVVTIVLASGALGLATHWLG